MGKLLWKPTKERILNANISKFIDYVNNKNGLEITNYDQLYDWSVEKIPDFWAAVWDFSGIKALTPYDEVVQDLTMFPGTEWFQGARLNFAENQLRYQDDHVALKFRGESQTLRSITYKELYASVSRIANSLDDLGVEPGDRVCGYMPNMIETAVAMLATTSIGAIWASCGVELGSRAALDRLGQIEPKVLFTVDGYYYKGKPFDAFSKAKEVANNIKSLKKVIVASYTEKKIAIDEIPNGIMYADFLSQEKGFEIQFEQLPFDHPVFIMFSSGTTGKPKCMVQGAGGVLINHLKELILHTDLRREDSIFYITSPSWMMWNWLLSSLSVGATVFLYDGNPNYPDPTEMWRIIEEEEITIFGCSATYLNYLRTQGIKPRDKFNLTKLKSISQTGSALSEEGYKYVYKHIKPDLHFNSISGGTDINGCFVCGSPIQPVHAGELQSRALGMKVKAYDENGDPVENVQGELVCEAPSPSMPLYFWNDPKNEKYLNAYFNYYPGKQAWRHGDYIIHYSDTGGITFFGRSDSVLKPSGVRIGTAEIYNVMEELKEVEDSLAIGQAWKNDQRILLFVQLAENQQLTDVLRARIKKILREKASPRHVPALILCVRDIPYTFSGKKVESAVTNMIKGKTISNRGALRNPDSLDNFEVLLPEILKE